MKVSNTAANELAKVLRAASNDGDYLLAYYPDSAELSASRIATFNDHFDAMQYCYDNSTDRDHCLYIRLEPVLEKLEMLAEKFAVLAQSGAAYSIKIDPAAIVDDYFNSKKNIMNIENIKPENLASLEKTFLYTGMNGISRDELIQKMAGGDPRFTLNLEENFGDGKASVKVYCELSAKGNYYADKYDITVSQEDKPDYTREYKFKSPAKVKTKDQDGELKDTWINSTVTLKEAYNQMCGRSINKNFVYVNQQDNEKNRLYNSWGYIDFTKTDGNGVHPVEHIYNYPVDKLEKELRAHPFMENKKPEDFDNLVSSLRRGNIQSVAYIKEDGSFEKIYLKANPKEQAVSKFDQNMQPIILSLKREQEVKEKQQQSVQKKAGDKEDVAGAETAQRKGKRNGVKAG